MHIYAQQTLSALCGEWMMTKRDRLKWENCSIKMCIKETKYNMIHPSSKQIPSKISSDLQREHNTLSRDEILSIFNNFDWLLWFSVFHGCYNADKSADGIESCACNISAFYVSNPTGWSLPIMMTIASMIVNLLLVFSFIVVASFTICEAKKNSSINTHETWSSHSSMRLYACTEQSVRSAFDAILCCCRTRITPMRRGLSLGNSFWFAIHKSDRILAHMSSILLVVFVAFKCSLKIERKENNEQQLAGRALNTFKCALNK